jgi:alkylation response protein AidB-like acyl-CoA dehydrogenase
LIFEIERWYITVSVVRGCRLVIEECFKWANQRMVFGKPLISQPVIRFKLAKMIAETESVQGWLENITYNMNKLSYKEQGELLAGPIALCKFLSTRVANNVSDDACQIFGGRGITKTGMGSVIEGMCALLFSFNATEGLMLKPFEYLLSLSRLPTHLQVRQYFGR